MTQSNKGAGRRGPVALSALIGRVLDPVSAKRGFATAELIAAWPEIVGTRYANTTQPEKIAWPNRGGPAEDGGTLTVRVDPASAVYFQHEVGQIIERVNQFLGFGAVRRIRVVQLPLNRAAEEKHAAAAALTDAEEASLASTVAGIDDDGLREALKSLGRGVLTGGPKQKGVPPAE